MLSGGVFQNRLLLERTANLVEEAGLRVLYNLLKQDKQSK